MMYHKMFDEIEKEAIDAVKKAIKSGLFRETPEKRIECLNTLHQELCTYYKLPVIEIKILEGWLPVGTYSQSHNMIIMNKISLVTYLHEFYHYKTFKENPVLNTEVNARGWSISLYYLAAPKLCEKAILSGKIIHQTSMEDSNEN